MSEFGDFTGSFPNLKNLEDLLAAPTLPALRQSLVAYLPRQRWFGAKSRTIQAVDILDSAMFPGSDAALTFLEVTYDDNHTSVYLLPLAITFGEEVERIRASHPVTIVANVVTPEGPGILHDAVVRESIRQAILELIATNGELSTRTSVLQGRRSSAFAAIRGVDRLAGRTGSAQQSNTSILYGTKLILKLFRRLQPGENPDTEIGRFLTETAHFGRIPPFLGAITLHADGGEQTAVALLQALVENEGDGWQVTLGELSRYYQNVATLSVPHTLEASASYLAKIDCPESAREHLAPHLAAARLLGTRTAEMHLALATPTDNRDFTAESFTADDLTADANRVESQLSLALEALSRSLPGFDDVAAEHAALVLRRRVDLVARARAIASYPPADFGQRIRIHGDYHLGQVLCSRGDYTIIDFEGEPAKTLAERRAKQSPLKDVAGMLRSFSYASHAAMNEFVERQAHRAGNLEPWRNVWENAVADEFLCAYQTSIEAANPHLIPRPQQAEPMLHAYLLEKVLYELRYELDNRPTWVDIPLAGIFGLLE